VLLLSLLAVLAGAETFAMSPALGRRSLRRFRPFRDGTPSHDHLGDIYATLDPAPAEMIAIDGKTSRRSGHKKGDKTPIYMVGLRGGPAPRARAGQGRRKSNEIVAILNLACADSNRSRIAGCSPGCTSP